MKFDNHLCLDKTVSWSMFDRISRRYDFMTRVFSFGLDGRWRRQVGKFFPDHPEQRILDVATGTGSLIISLVKSNPNIQKAYGIDLSENMLDVGRRRVSNCGLNSRIILQHGDALNMPFRDGVFDAVTMAFGIRNVPSVSNALKEILRVLKRGGRALILEFSLPPGKLTRAAAVFYIEKIIPLLGRLILRDRQAYLYLHQSIVNFPWGEDFCELMRQAGFKDVRANRLCLGMATIYEAEKSADGG